MSGEALVMYRGDDRSITLTIKEPNGTATDLTGASLWFSVWNAARSSRLFTKTVGAGITIETPATAGIATVVIANANTSGLSAADLDVALIWEAQLKKGSVITTVARGTIQIQTDIVTETS